MDFSDLLRQQQDPDLGGVNQVLTQAMASNDAAIPESDFMNMPAPVSRDPDADAAAAPKPKQIGPPNDPDGGLSLDDVDQSTPQNHHGVNLADMMVTPQDLEDAHSAQRRDLALGMIANALTNRQGGGNYYLGRMNQKTDMMPFFSKMADLEKQPIEDKQTLLKQALNSGQDKLALDAQDATSDLSKMMYTTMASNIQKNDQFDDQTKAQMIAQMKGKSALELNDLAQSGPYKIANQNDQQFLKYQNALAVAEERARAAYAAANNRSAPFEQRNEIQAFNSVKNDHDIIQMTTQSRNIQKAIDQMSDPNHPPSWTQMNEVAQDISAALSGKQVSSDFKLKEIKKGSVDQALGDLRAAATSNPDQPANPETVKFWLGMGNRLNDVYDRQISAKGKYLRDHSPSSMKSVYENATQPFVDGSWKGDTGGAPQSPPSAGASTTLMRDPHGNIRPIPNDQVEAAKQKGGVVVGG